MKHLKTFEKIGYYTEEDDKLNLFYRKGDLVKLLHCDPLDATWGFVIGDIYTIVTTDLYDELQYEISNDHDEIWVKEEDLSLPSKEEIEDYKIRKNSNKYNI